MKTNPCHTDLLSFLIDSLRAPGHRAAEWAKRIKGGADGGGMANDGIDAKETVPGNTAQSFSLAQNILFSRF